MLVTSCIFSSERGSPPSILIRLIYFLSASLKNFSIVSGVHFFPPLKSHVSLLKQFLQWKWQPCTKSAMPMPLPLLISSSLIEAYLILPLLPAFIFVVVKMYKSFFYFLCASLVPEISANVPLYPRFPDIYKGSILCLATSPFLQLSDADNYSRCTLLFIFSLLVLICFLPVF